MKVVFPFIQRLVSIIYKCRAGQFCQADRAGPEEEDTGINGGCERFRFISGADEIALNAEMGLYRSYFQAPWDLPKFTVFIIAGSLKSQTG